jgi:hypothetical protein
LTATRVCYETKQAMLILGIVCAFSADFSELSMGHSVHLEGTRGQSLTFTTQVCTNQGSSKVLKSIHQLVRGDSSKTKEVNFWSIESSPVVHLFTLLSVLSSQSLTWSPLLATGLFQTTCSYFTTSLCPLVPFLGF